MLHETFSFSSCGKVGAEGPTQNEVDDFYEQSNVKVTIVGSGIQKWTVPHSGIYLIEASGAEGESTISSSVGGKGASLKSQFFLEKNEILYILVGQMGKSSNSEWGGAGGGGSFVTKKVAFSNYFFIPDNSYVLPLIIASGGGGSGDNYGSGNKAGDDGHCEYKEEAGGNTGQEHSSGGAGFASNSKNGLTMSFLNGGIGSSGYADQEYSFGGFGSGGCSWDAGGGGGGYRGGDSGARELRGFGGYSFSQNRNISCISGANTGTGSVNITFSDSCFIQSINYKQNRIHFSIFIIMLIHS